MRLLTLPITVVRVPVELGFGAAKQALKFAHGLVGGGGEEPVAEKARPAPPTRRRSTSRKSGNGRAQAKTRSARRAAPAAPAPAEASAEPAAAPAAAEPPVAEATARPAAAEVTAEPVAEVTAEPAVEVTAEPAVEVTGEPAAAEAIVEPPVTDEPAHVSEEPELVAETAEAGAEDGAGPEVAVDEPWLGYDEMNAADIEDRLLTEGVEAAAAVRLYEASRKGRASVLEAASRSMTA